MNIHGSIDLMRLSLTAVATIHGKRCLVIPIEENDIFISADKETLKPRAAYLGLQMLERREQSNYGNTHYVKQSLSKAYRENYPQQAEEKRKVYLGDFKPLVIESSSQASIVSAPVVETDEDDMPF